MHHRQIAFMGGAGSEEAVWGEMILLVVREIGREAGKVVLAGVL